MLCFNDDGFGNMLETCGSYYKDHPEENPPNNMIRANYEGGLYYYNLANYDFAGYIDYQGIKNKRLEMLKKNQALALKRDSTMKMVHSCVELGIRTKEDISKETGLRIGQVKSALYNLAFIGLLRFKKENGNPSVYYLIDEIEAGLTNDCLKGINSIFNHRALPDDTMAA